MVFVTTLKYSAEKLKQDSAQDSAQDKESKLLEFCKTPKSLQEIMDFLNVSHRGYFKKTYLTPLLDKGIFIQASKFRVIHL